MAQINTDHTYGKSSLGPIYYFGVTHGLGRRLA